MKTLSIGGGNPRTAFLRFPAARRPARAAQSARVDSKGTSRALPSQQALCDEQEAR